MALTNNVSISENNSNDFPIDHRAAKKINLYALIVGICDYREDVALTQAGVSFPKLRGPVNDAKAIKAYLEADDYFEKHIIFLQNSEATKQAIAENFKNHLGRAGENDVVFFYFSGHGTQEYVDKAVFSSETDGKSEAIACYFDETSVGQALLADKELRWLLKQFPDNGAHCLTIFDCCHSAGITRALSLAETSFDRVVEKRIPYVFPKREWRQYLFAESMQPGEIQTAGESNIMQEHTSVQFSACESNEPALEVNEEGVFTKALLKVLKASNGQLTYAGVLSQVRQYLKGVYQQKPRIYFTGDEAELTTLTFLNKPCQLQHTSLADVVYNEEIGWVINRGSLHGLKVAQKQLNLFHKDDPLALYPATLTSVDIDSASLSADNLDTGKLYHVVIEGLMKKKINLHIAESMAAIPEQLLLVDDVLKNLCDNVTLTEDESKADYVLRYLNGYYYFTKPFDTYRPLAKILMADRNTTLAQISGELLHLSTWNYLWDLGDDIPSPQTAEKAVQIDIALADAEFVRYEGEDLLVDYQKKGVQWASKIKIRLTNILQTQPVYCCVLLLSADHAAFPDFLNPAVYLLEPGNSVELRHDNKNDIVLTLEETTVWYNLDYTTERVKVIVSADIFSADELTLSQLPQPKIPGKDDTERGEKGMVQSLQKSPASLSGWYTANINLRYNNPLFNTITEDKLARMLKDEETADFALGLYFDATVGDNLAVEYKLKPSISLITPQLGTVERGIITDGIINVANWWARNARNKIYRNSIAKYPKRLRIVSEGDSWFQHPLVFDIIDHLSRTYSVCCAAAAGDTLRNMFSGQVKRGEFYLDVIEREQPSFFLLSGGGNDILGEQFRTFLINDQSDLPEGNSPVRFLKPSLMDEVRELMQIYKTLFSLLNQRFPSLKIIVHGYDYPVKLDDNKKGWLGRYMIENGITRRGDRQAIIHHIMDNFNALLKQEAEAATNVTYLDLRNLVRFDPHLSIDQWYDEIHPNDDGFQQVAVRYIQKINQLSS